MNLFSVESQFVLVSCRLSLELLIREPLFEIVSDVVASKLVLLSVVLNSGVAPIIIIEVQINHYSMQFMVR